jgi:hypothetical protein
VESSLLVILECQRISIVLGIVLRNLAGWKLFVFNVENYFRKGCVRSRRQRRMGISICVLVPVGMFTHLFI